MVLNSVDVESRRKLSSIMLVGKNLKEVCGVNYLGKLFRGLSEGA